MGISIIKIRLSWDRLIFLMGIHLLGKRRLHIETAPRNLESKYSNCLSSKCFWKLCLRNGRYFTGEFDKPRLKPITYDSGCLITPPVTRHWRGSGFNVSLHLFSYHRFEAFVLRSIAARLCIVGCCRPPCHVSVSLCADFLVQQIPWLKHIKEYLMFASLWWYH